MGMRKTAFSERDYLMIVVFVAYWLYVFSSMIRAATRGWLNASNWPVFGVLFFLVSLVCWSALTYRRAALILVPVAQLIPLAGALLLFLGFPSSAHLRVPLSSLLVTLVYCGAPCATVFYRRQRYR
jgi:hypothetical protein